MPLATLPLVGSTRASSQGQMPTPPAALTRDEINRYRREPPVSPSALRFLRVLRERHVADITDNFFLHDLTDSGEFHWRAWVSQRHDAKDIVGPGIYRFAFVWVSVKDNNHPFHAWTWTSACTHRSANNAPRSRERQCLCGARGWASGGPVGHGGPKTWRRASTEPVPRRRAKGPRRRAKLRSHSHGHSHTTASRRRT